MKKIGITGSLSSGKTTASKIISFRKGPVFFADKVVKKIYTSKKFKKIIKRKFNLDSNINLKDQVRNKIYKNKTNLKKLEHIIHPLVRKEMLSFSKKNKKENLLFFEIPLLIENGLNNYFDIIFFIRSKKNLRLKRFKSRSKKFSTSFFNFLNNQQMKDLKKMKYCDHVVVNNKSLSFFKKKLLSIMSKYE